MTIQQIDRALGQSPCCCGSFYTWHPACYAGKTDEAIAAGHKRAYAAARRVLAKERRNDLRVALLQRYGDSRGSL